MRIKRSSLTEPMDLALTGHEDWLGSIYGDFPLSSSGPDRSLITGELSLKSADDGAVAVRGWLTYAPTVSCARCDQGIPWSIKTEVDVLFVSQDQAALSRDVNLSEGDLEYYVLDRDEVDLQSVVNDAIQTALPSRLIASSDDGKSCNICGIDLSVTKVSTTAQGGTSSPFAALQGLKLKG